MDGLVNMAGYGDADGKGNGLRSATPTPTARATATFRKTDEADVCLCAYSQ
jgi:hypothetical protein